MITQTPTQVEPIRARSNGRQYWLTVRNGRQSQEIEVSEMTYRRALAGLPVDLG